jgi:TonB-linked SusC/RagA family outer membrane protein
MVKLLLAQLKKKHTPLILLGMLLSLSLQAQVVVTGIVKDSVNNDGLPGVSILVKGTNSGTTTDNDGKFSVQVPNDKSTLVFTFIGYRKQEIFVGSQTQINVQLTTDISTLEEVMVVGYGTQKKESVIAAISTVEVKQLKVPSSNLTTALAGRVAGVIAYQRSGEPGADNATFFIRGVTTFGYKKDPLILLDNNEISTREMARLQTDDIASFSILKDATATSLYGSRGANGVILITTKRGVEGKARLTMRFENTFTMPTQQIELADPVTYMKLHNEAVRTRNTPTLVSPEPYSQSKIENTMLADRNQYVYPATDWYQAIFKDYAVNKRFNFNLSGGNKLARYYLAGSINNDNGLLNVDKRNNFNSNINLTTYMLRSNVTMDVTSTTQVTARLQGIFDEYKGPIGGGDNIYRQVMSTNPVMFPAYYSPDSARQKTKHILFGNAARGGSQGPGYNNPYANLAAGYRNYSTANVMAQFELRQELDFITKGLWARGLFNTNRFSNFEVRRFYQPFFYNVSHYDKANDTYRLLPLNPTTGTEYLDYEEPEDRKLVESTMYMEAAINWDRVYNEKHAVGALIVTTRRQQLKANAGDLQRSLPYRNMSTAGRFTYSYDTRYFVEFNFGYNGSERFSEKYRFGFFPSVGLAWYVSNEAFWGSLSDKVTKLKLRGTYGQVGNDAIGNEFDRFFYLSNVNPNNNTGTYFGTYGNIGSTNQTGGDSPGYSITRYANDQITWERANKMNIGFELNLFGKLEIQGDYFTERRDNILMDRLIPTTTGLGATVRSNVGEAKSHGFDISVNLDHTFNNGVWLAGMGNFTYAVSEFTKVEEPDFSTSPWSSRVGTSLNQIWGYVAERLFVDDEEVRNSPTQFGQYRGGDIKYKDLNNDGVINLLDQVPMGYPTVPEIVYGFGFSGGKKAIDFSFFFQGQSRVSMHMNTVDTSPFIDGQNALLQAYADSHWSEENRDLYATWPRLSSNYVVNNLQGSSWFIRNGAFLRLKSVELGYTLPSDLISKIKMSNMRIYFNGTNLLTFSKFKLWDPELGGNRDPNANNGIGGLGYPIQKVYNIGVQATF